MVKRKRRRAVPQAPPRGEQVPPPSRRLIEVISEVEAASLADALTRTGRTRPAAVITTAAGASHPYVDEQRVFEAVGDLCDVYVIPTGAVSWAFSRGLPDGRQVYGGASRVYGVNLDWLEDMRRSVLRFAYGPADRDRVTEQLIHDAMAAAHDAGQIVTAPIAESRRVSGRVMGTVGGSALVEIDGVASSYAAIWPELVLPGIGVDQMFCKGMRVQGRLDVSSHRLDVAEMVPPGGFALTARPGDVLLCRVAAVARDTCSIELLPGTSANLTPFDVTGDSSADLRLFLSPGEVVVAELREPGDGPVTRLFLRGDVDPSSATAAPLFPGGPPWLLPPSAPDLVAATDDVVTPAHHEPTIEPAGAGEASALRFENEELRAQLARRERRVRELTRERDDARASARAAKQRASRVERDAADIEMPRLPHPDFGDRSQEFRFRVHVAWAMRTTAHDKLASPWRDWSMGGDFLDSLDEVQGLDEDKLAEVVADVVTGRADSMHVYDMHQLRSGPGGEDAPVVRGAGETCWRVALQRNTPAARRLHFWRRSDGSVELSSVRLHDDFRP